MKKLLCVCGISLVTVLSSGCTAKESATETVATESTVIQSQQMNGQAIVIFNKGITFDEAEKILAASDMKIEKKYKTLSEQNGQLYLLVTSSKTTEAMVDILKNESSVHSVSANRRSGL